DLYGMNLLHFLDEMGGAAKYKIDHENDAVRPALVLEAGEKKWPAPPMAKKEAPAAAKAPETAKPAPRPAETPKVPSPKSSHGPAQRPPSAASGIALSLLGLVAAAVWVGLRYGQADAAASGASYLLLSHLTV